MQRAKNNGYRMAVPVIFLGKPRDSKPERVSTVKKTVRWTVFRCEVRGGYAARTQAGNAGCIPCSSAQDLVLFLTLPFYSGVGVNTAEDQDAAAHLPKGEVFLKQKSCQYRRHDRLA